MGDWTVAVIVLIIGVIVTLLIVSLVVAFQDDRGRCLEAGAFVYLPRPIIIPHASAPAAKPCRLWEFPEGRPR